METSKSKAKAKAKTADKSKKSATTKSVTAKKAKVIKSVVSEEEIRLKAQEIYNDRISRGESGTSEGDWLKAEELLKR